MENLQHFKLKKGERFVLKPSTIVEPKLMSFQRTMETLNLSRYTLNQLLDAGKLKAVYVDGKPYFDTKEVKEFASPVEPSVTEMPKMLSIADAIKYSGLPECAIRKFIKSGKLPYLCSGKKFYIAISDMDRLVENGDF